MTTPFSISPLTPSRWAKYIQQRGGVVDPAEKGAEANHQEISAILFSGALIRFRGTPQVLEITWRIFQNQRQRWSVILARLA